MDEFHKQKMKTRLAEAARWVVQEGCELVATAGSDEVRKVLIKRWACQLWVEPRLDDGRYLALIRIKGAGISYDIHCLQRAVSSGELYEYWLFKVAAESWTSEQNRCHFLVARTKHVKSRREIIHESETFFSTFPAQGRPIIILPISNLQLLYDMQAWLFPKNYGGSPLSEMIVRPNGDGTYSQSPAASPAARPR